MKFQVMLTLLGVLFIVIAFSFFQKRKVENFTDDTDSQRLRDYKRLDKELTNADARRYNYVSDGMNDFLGGFFNPQRNNEPVITKQIQDAVNNVQVVGLLALFCRLVLYIASFKSLCCFMPTLFALLLMPITSATTNRATPVKIHSIFSPSKIYLLLL